MPQPTVSPRVALLATAAALTAFSAAGAQQTDVSVAPFVSFLPSTGASPLAGLALTLAGNSGFAVRGSGHLSLSNDNNNSFNTTGMRPWGADADAMFFLGGRSYSRYQRGISPFVFAGIGVAGADSLGTTVTHKNWSYGAGLTVPLGGAVDLFGESRWRMSRYVLPTSHFAPSPSNELRFGVSFHVGAPDGESHSRRGRERMREASLSDVSLPLAPVRPMLVPARAPAAASRIVAAADEFVGVPFRVGGTSPTTGFDAAGFTQYVFGTQGVRLPRTAAEQARVGSALPSDWSAIAPGDLVMFEQHGQIDHVAIYAGNNRIIHSTATGGGVRYDDLATTRGEWFEDHMVALRRVTAGQ